MAGIARGRRIKFMLAASGVAMGVAISVALYARPTPRHDDHAYEGIYRTSADPILRVELIPRSKPFINGDGFIGRDYARAKPPNTWRVVGVGDSVTMYYSAEQLSYLSLLERSLPSVVGRDVEVLNLAVVSYETREQVQSLATRGLRYDPDFVVVGYCVNDGTDFVQLAQALGVRDVKGRWSDDNLDVHMRIRDAVRASDALDPAQLFAVHIEPELKWRQSLAAFEQLQALAARDGFGVLVVLFPSLFGLDDYFLAALHVSLRVELERLGMHVLDLWPAFREAGAIESMRTNLRDALHPNAAGHRVAAEAIEAWLSARRPWERAAR